MARSGGHLLLKLSAHLGLAYAYKTSLAACNGTAVKSGEIVMAW